MTGVHVRLGRDFKAGLATKADRSDLKLRDVIAVFSQSHLPCLGLALSITRSLHEGARFIVLDDPTLSSDEDHRAFFTTGVVEKLLDGDPGRSDPTWLRMIPLRLALPAVA